MQNTHQQNIQKAEDYHHSLALAEASIRKKLFGAKLRRGFHEISHFGISAVLIFAVAFAGMNFGAYKKKFEFEVSEIRANVLAKMELQANTEALKETQRITLPKRPPKFQIKETEDLPSISIAPPDNRIVIPRLDIRAPIKEAENVNLRKGDWTEIEDQVQDALQDGVVHFPGTAEAGERGNAFLTGHSSYYPLLPGRYKDIFALLPELVVGDEIEVWQNQKKYTYTVSDIKEVDPSEVDVLEDTSDYRLTLMTCTPLGTALRRLIVTSKLLGT